MMEKIPAQNTEKQIQDLITSGLNCAEAVLKVFLDENESSDSPHQSFARLGSDLMGGIGGPQQATCGALLGCCLVLGQLFRKSNPWLLSFWFSLKRSTAQSTADPFWKKWTRGKSQNPVRP